MRDISFTAHIFKEGDVFVAHVPGLDVSSWGDTTEAARRASRVLSEDGIGRGGSVNHEVVSIIRLSPGALVTRHASSVSTLRCRCVVESVSAPPRSGVHPASIFADTW